MHIALLLKLSWLQSNSRLTKASTCGKRSGGRLSGAFIIKDGKLSQLFKLPRKQQKYLNWLIKVDLPARDFYQKYVEDGKQMGPADKPAEPSGGPGLIQVSG